MKLDHPTIDHRNNTTYIILSCDDYADLSQTLRQLGAQLREEKGYEPEYHIVQQDDGAALLSMQLNHFATISSYLEAQEHVEIEPDILKTHVLHLIESDMLNLGAGLVTNSRTNSTIASMMLGNAFDAPIRHIAFDCPLHCEEEMWAKIIHHYEQFQEATPAHMGTTNMIWRAHAERLTDDMFGQLSDLTDHVAIYTRNPNLVLESIIRGRMLNNTPSSGDMIGVLAKNLDDTLSDDMLYAITTDTSQHAMLQNNWSEASGDRREAVEKLLDIYAQSHSDHISWADLKSDILQSKNYTELDDILTVAYDKMAPENPHELPSAMYYPMRDPFGFSEKSYQKQSDFLKMRQEKGKDVVVVDASSLRTIDDIRMRFGEKLGVSPSLLVTENMQERLPAHLLGDIPEETRHLIGKTLASDEVKRLDKPLISSNQFPQTVQKILKRELVLYGEQMSNPAALGAINADELHRIIHLDTSKPISGTETTNMEDAKALINVDPLFCLVMAENCYRHTMDPYAQEMVTTLEHHLENSLFADQAKKLTDTMRGPESSYIQKQSQVTDLHSPAHQRAI